LAQSQLTGKIDPGKRAAAQFFEQLESFPGCADFGPTGRTQRLFREFGIFAENLMTLTQHGQRIADVGKLTAVRFQVEFFTGGSATAIFQIRRFDHDALRTGLSAHVRRHGFPAKQI
jgi:hypothetical protein